MFNISECNDVLNVRMIILKMLNAVSNVLSHFQIRSKQGNTQFFPCSTLHTAQKKDGGQSEKNPEPCANGQRIFPA